MALKLTYPASEFLFDIKNLPSQILREMGEFKKRNRIIGEIYCKKCFNAHILKKAREYKLREDLIIKLKDNFESEIGHHGYYLDGDELIKL
ncbi:hypothetical protein HYW75_03715 [Candidatus Pacearchaeota archaeon]|nr:hypothetical protein [Candidatus Pacearchaeota archaeon]